MKRLIVTALDKDGKVMAEDRTREEWYLSEVACFLQALYPAIHSGQISHICISVVVDN
jgi:hypothetical protein